MALSQIQCLDDYNVNPRTNESKPDFLYSEDQRLALEVLLREGREPFHKFVEERQIRSFLSDLEQEMLTKTMEPYDPGSDIFPEDADENEDPLSQHYWPELSDMSIPQMDLGWPHTEAYRGVTRTTVYTQPPLEGQTHIKEIVRRMIAQAQKVIAVVMDVFTDVDIFKDLIDAGFRRKVSIYILLESTSLPHFLSMCQRANMHAGHLKHLRVRCTEGTEFYTRSCTKVKGRLGHRFMFIDGDKAVSGSFSFTWMSSRLDKNLVTVVTGQAVEAFDHVFRHLYSTSRFVDLQQVAMEPEPQREPLPHLEPVVLSSTNVTKKMYNPKYALLGENTSANSPKESQTTEVPDTKKRRRGRESKEPTQEEEDIHPGLLNLEKAYLIPYLPTWPEPDPPSDVIGFINIMDMNRPTQVHLQRSERFEVSQAIRFRDPFTMPEAPMPEVAKPRQTPTQIEEKTNPPPSQDRIQVRDSIYDRLHRVDSTDTKADKLDLHSVSSTGQNEGQAKSSNIEHIRRSTGNLEPASEQRKSSEIRTAAETLNPPSPVDSNSRTEHTETKTTHPVQANHTESSHSPSKSHTSHPSSSSSSSSSNQTLKTYITHPTTKDRNISNGPSTLQRLNSLTRDEEAIHKSVGEIKSAPKIHENSNRKMGLQKDDTKSDAFQKNQEDKQKETSVDNQNKKSVGLHDRKEGTQVVSGNKRQIQSDASLAPNVNLQKNTLDDTKPLRPSDCDGSSKTVDDLESKATLKQLTDPDSRQTLNESESSKKTYHVKENKPQRISYSQSSPLTMWERIQAATIETSTDRTDAASTKSSDNTANPAKKSIRRLSQDSPQSPKEQTPEKTVQSTKRERRSISAVRRTSADLPSRIPTLEMSPGYRQRALSRDRLRDLSRDRSRALERGRSRDDSNRSSTSEEFVECSDSPIKEVERHGKADTADDTETKTSNKSSSVFLDYTAYVALFDPKTKPTSSKETQGLEKKVKTREKEDVKSRESGIKKTANRDSKGKERWNVEVKSKTLEKEKEAQNQALGRKSRTQRGSGSGNVDNRDGSAKEVAGQNG
ncbi:protein FAM83G [Syngnathus scovelli]|uniref:protein FAM83G n=1 Tax=Syngnathus scovelli TaxID=161590 RepID=UPI00211086B1|nr:protein FAM83G [Syngnathus scovelli]